MKTVKQACQLATNALSIDVSDQIEQLDQLIQDEGNGESFYAKTFITAGMRDLLRGTIERLAGKSSNAVFHLKQAMGGGKTHLIVGTGLVAKHPDLRQKYCADIPASIAFGTARVVAFNGRNSPVHYFWGEIAHQLGETETFKKFWLQGPDAPDETAWTKLLQSETPTLILLDEMPPYFQYLGTKPLGTGTVADIATRAFANMLSAAGKLKNVCIVVSDLDASYAEGGALIERALMDARKELGRQEKAITPVDLAGNEVYDILRKRLFVELPDLAVIEDVAAKYGEALGEATKSKVIARGAEAQADEIVKTYPFHPRLKELVALFKENEQFKQTRGLMELMSRLLKSVWEREDE
ncbi:MAG: ATP-binding protein, partial [Limnohabitans sp.]|nr:ATP-binding protein [Limnohabitans sp.]